MTRVWLLALLLAGCAPEDADAPAHGTPAPPADPATPSAPGGPPPVGPADSTAAADSLTIGDPPTRVPGPLRAPPTEWTTRTVEVERAVEGVAVHRSFRAAAHEEYDRLVFAFEGATLPGYHVEYVDRPAHACGSGEAVYLDGEGWLAVTFRPAQAHDDGGRATVAERRPRLDLPLAREAALTCDFEADVTWVVGLASPNPFRVDELADPPRLVVDVRR